MTRLRTMLSRRGRILRTVRASWVLLLVAAGACAPNMTAAPPSSAPEAAPPGEAATLVRIVDGDTIVVRVGGREERVRLIGIDTPERDACYFGEATVHLSLLIGGRRLGLERDVSERDRYGRLLRYVYAGDVFLNAAMIRDGYALASTYPPDVAHAAEFVALQRAARLAERGLWNEGACR